MLFSVQVDYTIRKKDPDPFEYERQSVIAIASIYGIDLLADNVDACRERLYNIWNTEYEAVCGKETNEECRKAVKFILNRNIVCGNALTMMCVDGQQRDTDEPIVFSEWTFPFNDTRVQRKDYSFAELMQSAEIEEDIRRTGQMNLFANADGEVEPTFLRQYIFDYRRPNDYDE